MNWNKGKKENLHNIEQVNLSKWVINLSQKDYTPVNPVDDEEITDNIEYLPIIVNKLPNINVIKQSLIKLQNEYDSSDEVNSFTINGITSWMDKTTRNSLKETLNVIEKLGQDKYTLWLANNSINLPINQIRDFLDNLELYAINCYQTTSEHISEINKINNQEDLFKFDISNGYPQKIELTL